MINYHLQDGTIIDVDTIWEQNIVVGINIKKIDKNNSKNSLQYEKMICLDLTEKEAIRLCKEIMDSIYKYNDMEKSSLRHFLEEAHAKSNTDE